MRKTAVYRDDLFLKHDPGFGHVESPERLRVVYRELDREEIGKNFVTTPGFEPASHEDLALNHAKSLIKKISKTAGKSHDYLDADTQTSADSYDAARLAAGAVIDGVKRIWAEELDNAFCLVRPPGHHAERSRAMGFCLFNNVAVAAKWALANLGLDRILIVDWDLHHGNGTQQSFYDTDKVLYFSTHQYPYYPGSGALLETGKGNGEGFTVNVPLSGGLDDHAYAAIFNQLLAPVARLYKPQLILVSCGFDIYKNDPLGGMAVTAAGFAYLTRVMVELARELCGGRLLFTLEGGYNLDAMRDGSLAVLSELVGQGFDDGRAPFLSEQLAAELQGTGRHVHALEQALTVFRNYWDI